MNKRNEITVDALVKQMAIHFEENIPVSTLAKWVGLANFQLYNYLRLDKTETEKTNYLAATFLSEIGYTLLPKLIECKDKNERIICLNQVLPGMLRLHDVEAIIHEIGVALMDHIRIYGTDSDNCITCLDVLKHLVLISNMYDEIFYLEESQEAA